MMELTEEEIKKAFEHADEIRAAFYEKLQEEHLQRMENDPKYRQISGAVEFYNNIKVRPYSLQDMIPVGQFAEDFTNPR